MGHYCQPQLWIISIYFPLFILKKLKILIHHSHNGAFQDQWKQMMKQIIQMNITWFQIPTGSRQASWLFTNILQIWTRVQWETAPAYWSEQDFNLRPLDFKSRVLITWPFCSPNNIIYYLAKTAAWACKMKKECLYQLPKQVKWAACLHLPTVIQCHLINPLSFKLVQDGWIVAMFSASLWTLTESWPTSTAKKRSWPINHCKSGLCCRGASPPLPMPQATNFVFGWPELLFQISLSVGYPEFHWYNFSYTTVL